MSEPLHVVGIHPASPPLVYIIDDDASVRIALERLLISAGIRVRTFPSALDFLQAQISLDRSCIVADVMMRDMTGLEFQEKLRVQGARVSFIFVTAYDTDEARAQAKRAGAVAYFRKPVDDQALIDAIGWAQSHVDDEKK